MRFNLAQADRCGKVLRSENLLPRFMCLRSILRTVSENHNIGFRCAK